MKNYAILRGNELSKKVSRRTHPINTIRPKTMFGSVSMHFVNFRHEKLCKTCVSGQNALFRGAEIPKKVSLRRHPIYSTRPKMMFGSVSRHFANHPHEKYCKTFVSRPNSLFRGTKLPDFFCHDCIQSNKVDPTWCLGVFQGIPQTFGTKNYAKLMFRAWMHYFEVPIFRKKVSLWTHPIYFIRP